MAHSVILLCSVSTWVHSSMAPKSQSEIQTCYINRSIYSISLTVTVNFLWSKCIIVFHVPHVIAFGESVAVFERNINIEIP